MRPVPAAVLDLPTVRLLARKSTCPHVDFLKESASPGRALTHEEETALLDAASKSRCRSLYPVVMLALNTGMRASEIRGLTSAAIASHIR